MIITFEEALVARLLAVADISAILGNKINWVARPEGTGLPAITLTVVSDPFEYTHDGRDDWQQMRVQFDFRALQYITTKQLSRLTLEAMEQDAEVGDVHFDGARKVFGHDAPREALGGGTEVFHYVMDLMIPAKPK